MMSKPMPLKLVGGTAFGRYSKISTEETFNMMISNDALVPYPGYTQKAVLALGGEGRELYYSSKNKHLYAVVNNGFYSIDQNMGVSKIASLETETGDVFIAENDANQIGIADGEKIYTYNYSTSTFTTVTTDFLPNYIGFMDGYFIAAARNTNTWRLSAPNNGNSWPDDAPNVGPLETKPDNVVATVPMGRSLFVFGKTVCEIWYDMGYQLFPFQRNNSYTPQYGCLSAATIATNDNLIVWLAANEKSGPVIMYSEGGQPQPIAGADDMDGINFILSHLKTPEDSYGFLFKQAGHIIYQITFPSDNVSYAFDFTTKKFFTVTDEYLNYHIARRVAYFNNGYYFLSFKDGALYQMSTLVPTYAGNEIPRIRKTPNIRMADSSPFIVDNVNITLEQGNAANVQRVDLSMSKDGGVSFSNTMGKTLNTIGNRQNRLNFWGLGRANDLVLQFRFWSEDRFVITGATASIYQ